jgi:hypothetical protein
MAAVMRGGGDMPYNQDFVTPCGKTYAQIDADEAQYIAAVNEALDSLRGRGCRWWNYMVSHQTLELVVGDPLARESNLVLCLAACGHISGPVSWEKHQLRVTWDNDRQRDKAWVFTVHDDSVKFKAVGGVFSWRRDYDLHRFRSIYLPRENSGGQDGR